MSVICQNFVQNAWKKDLCSNCFKSFGDHDHSGDTELEDRVLENPDDINQNVRYISQSTTVYPSRTNPAPHATWKSLISENNNKNCKPFKLETGFQGRLLTINKAGFDKKLIDDSTFCNNGGPNSLPIIDDKKSTYRVFSNVRNGEVVKSSTNNFQKSQTMKNGITSRKDSELNQKIADKNNCNDVATRKNKIEQNLQNKSNGQLSRQNERNNEVLTTATKITARNNSMSSLTQFKAVENNEDTQFSPKTTSMRSILKKTVSLPTINSNINKTRRGSNVGFKDGEPLVIGYGGRDFSPEELEWESASSDGEHDCTADSTDETEDDKVFSKMTKQNTEFNSDTANLLQNGVNGIGEHKENNIKEENKMMVGKILKTGRTSSQPNKYDRNESMATSLSANNMSKGRRYEKKQNGVSHDNVKKSSNSFEKSTNDDYKDGSYLKVDNYESKENKRQTLCSETSVPECEKNGTIKSDEMSQQEDRENRAKLSEKVVEDARAQNNFVNGVFHKVTDSNSGDVLPSQEAVMFSDTADSSSEQKPWNGGNEILQAINISLTNRHSLREEAMLKSDVETSLQKVNEEIVDPVETVTSPCHTIDSESEAKSPTGEFSTVEVKNGVDAINVEPRASFLHGSASNTKDVPYAIYGPGSDLFVSRSSSSSSSSSSSEELRKSQVSLSVSVTVNNGAKCSPDSLNEEPTFETGSPAENVSESEQVIIGSTLSHNTCKIKPKIPAKPLKPPPCSRPESAGSYSKSSDSSEDNRITVNRKKANEAPTPNGVYYSIANNASNEKIHKSVTLIDPYAESNIYHEVNKMPAEEDVKLQSEGRESKLAALAMELEQVRHNGSNAITKRQAPAPPKVPDPPLEDPPSCSARTPSPSDVPHFSSFKGEAMGFSSASSTTSSSSQDTETGFTSWHVGPKSSKSSKSSFLLTQYSKCKLLAMGYSEDSSRSKKKFSLKKLLKLGKEVDSAAAAVSHDPNCPNPKAWKYSDHFDRPRAKLEIIHPMDLENRSVTVNPGFDSLHSGSMSTFSVNDNASMRNSVSSDYGSYYSDTMSPPQERSEVSYEYIQPRVLPNGAHEASGRNGSASPTPSRCSSTSQASTLTSGSSKNSVHRPPKPPPPPRAYSLLPASKTQKNPDGTFKFPVGKEDTSSTSDDSSPPKPQAPVRHSKGAAPRCEYDNFMETKSIPEKLSEPENSPRSKVNAKNRLEEYTLETETVGKGEHKHNVLVMNSDTSTNHLPPISKQFESIMSSLEKSVEDITALESLTLTPENNEHDTSDDDVPELESDRSTECRGTTPLENRHLKLSKSAISRNKHPPLTKSPPRQPPIYTKTQTAVHVKKNPWQTLEDSYVVLSSSNREILTRLVNQVVRKRQKYMDKLCKSQLSWSCFEIDTRQASSVFAFGDKIAYHATVPNHPEFRVTLVITIQQQPCGLNVNDMRYPVLGQFTDSVPGELLDDSKNPQLDSMQATVLVLDRSTVTTVECFLENLPDSLTEENEKELCFIILQLIQSLKSFQAQGIETLDASFQHLILVKLKQSCYYTLVFLTDSYLEDIDSNYMTDLESNRVSLCQYALMLLFQTFKIQSAQDFGDMHEKKFSSEGTQKIFEVAISFLSEEKAVSLSQTKTLLECFLWGVTNILNSNPEDMDGVMHRWLDIERSYFIKNIVNDETSAYISTQDEFYSQFLTRTSIRNIREVTCYL